jgi:hypothetical protein
MVGEGVGLAGRGVQVGIGVGPAGPAGVVAVGSGIAFDGVSVGGMGVGGGVGDSSALPQAVRRPTATKRVKRKIRTDLDMGSTSVSMNNCTRASISVFEARARDRRVIVSQTMKSR